MPDFCDLPATLGDLNGYYGICCQLCQDGGEVIVSVEYRLAVEHPSPAAIDDAWIARQRAAANIEEFGSETGLLAFAGDSVGAMLAIVMTILARDCDCPYIGLQALLYPTDAGRHDGDLLSRSCRAGGPTLNQRTVECFSRYVFGPSSLALDFRSAPLPAKLLVGPPPTLHLVAGFDLLRDEMMVSGEALRATECNVSSRQYPGSSRGFVSMADTVDTTRLAHRQMGEVLCERLATA